MGIFKRKTRVGDRPDTLSFRFGKWYKANEMRLAAYLNKKTMNISSKGWLMLLISFCAVVGSYLIKLLLGIFN